MNSTPSDPSSQRSIEFETRFAWLERHVVDQDKVILDLSEELRRIKREFQEMRKRIPHPTETDAPGETDERPPHY